MLRHFTGSSLAALLLALMVTKNVALGFCLCQQHIIIGHDPTCCAQTPAPPACCCEEEDTPAESPCKDCLVDLKLDVGDFLWSSEQFSPADQLGTPLPAPVSTPSLLPVARHATPFPQNVRGSPPDHRPPLYLRTSVFRL